MTLAPGASGWLKSDKMASILAACAAGSSEPAWTESVMATNKVMKSFSMVRTKCAHARGSDLFVEPGGVGTGGARLRRAAVAFSFVRQAREGRSLHQPLRYCWGQTCARWRTFPLSPLRLFD